MAPFTRVLVYFLRNCGLAAFLSGIFAVVALWGGFSAREHYLVLARLEGDGVAAAGETTTLREYDAGDKGQKDMRYFVTCRFLPGDGGAVERETRLFDEGRWRGLRVGDPLALRYSASDPAVWDVPDGGSAPPARGRMVSCFIAGGVGAAFFFSLWAGQTYVRRRWPEQERR
jgi:hypothetical protein